MQPAQLWQLGDYPTVGDRWATAGEELVDRVVRPDHRVLDVATGAGVVAIAAARLGASVTGVDVAPSLLAEARRRADRTGVGVRWVEADMTALPEPDGGYDRVLSAFGAMFAPDPVAMAAELVRVCRPGGLVGVLAWTPESPFAMTRPMFAAYLPPGNTGPQTEAWGDPDRVGSFFSTQPVTVETTPGVVEVRWPTLDAAVEEMTTLVPGCVAARPMIEPTGAWPRAVAELHDLFATAGHADARGFVLPVPYLTTTATRWC